MKCNFPVRYTLMPVYEANNKKGYSTVFYVVSKCYVINEVKSYLVNGDFTSEYEVTFPYKKSNKTYDDNEKYFLEESYILPFYNRVYPDNDTQKSTASVKKVFFTFADAKDYANKVNAEKLYNNPNKTKINQFIDAFEKEIEEKTSDMRINISRDKPEVIMEIGNVVRIIDVPNFYNLLETSTSHIAVYYVEKSRLFDFKEFVDIINNNYSKKLDLRTFGNKPILVSDVDNKLLIIEERDKRLGSLKRDNGTLTYYQGSSDEIPAIPKIKLYTMTEDINSIIDSYQKSEDITYSSLCKNLKKEMR